MRFLIDNALSYRLANVLNDNNHDTLHVRDIELASASDDTILAYAQREKRIIISADTDFGTLLANLSSNEPSFILFRWAELRDPTDQARVLLENLTNIQEALLTGAVVVIEPARIRVRSLPIKPTNAD